MYKQATRLTLALTALLGLSTAATRHPRSLWPWSSSQTTEEPLIPEKQAEILRQSGYGEYLDLSRHPVWKIHKYEGIELKPVRVEAEIIKPAEAPNPVSSVAPLTESGASEQPPDLSFLDNLGGLAYFLPDADDAEETDKANVLAGAIASEERSHPGFFGKLWSKLWGSDGPRSAEVLEDDSALPRIALPATKQNYAEITLLRPSERLADAQRPTLDRPPQYAFAAGAGQAAQPVDKWYKPAGHFSRSQAWVQSWNPNAAYDVRVQGPSEYPAEHVATVQAYTAGHFQSKASKDESVDRKSADTMIEADKNAEAPSDSLASVSKDEEKKEIADVNNDPQTSAAASDKRDNAEVNADPEISTSGDASVADGESPRKISEGERAKGPLALVAAAEGQGQEVAGRLESSSVASGARASSLRQKAVSALRLGLVPKTFLRQLNIGDQEIEDFVENRESSNQTWEKIRNHLHKLAPRFPAVRKIFFV